MIDKGVKKACNIKKQFIAERVDHLPLSHASVWARHLDYGNLEGEVSLGNVKNKAGSLSPIS